MQRSIANAIRYLQRLAPPDLTAVYYIALSFVSAPGLFGSSSGVTTFVRDLAHFQRIQVVIPRRRAPSLSSFEPSTQPRVIVDVEACCPGRYADPTIRPNSA